MRSEGIMRIYVDSLGCKLNQSEMDALASRLLQRGHRIVRASGEADLCILNTCAVTHVAARKSRQALRRWHRDNPSARLVATGCYAELAPADLRDLPGVELVVGNHDKERLEEKIGAELLGQPAGGKAVPSPSFFPPSAPPSVRTRALVKIQDGCDNACSYCVVRVARGPQRSCQPDQVLEAVRARLAAGYQEIVLTGVHLGAYGRDRGEHEKGPDLWALVARILTETQVPRLRLSSIEPWDLPDEAFRLWADPRLCRHLHLPLQSGYDATLRRMARRYTSAEFTALVRAARAAIPGVAVTTDVIVGFPGETDAEFAQSLTFVQRMDFARVHVFPYSRRSGTPAAQMPDQVAPQAKAKRARAMRAIADTSGGAFRRRFIGQILPVLWESSWCGETGPVWSGLTDNYLRVHVVSSADLANTITATRLVSLNGTSLQGQIEI
jgi:threonylcarbamoyladenosine tRNA methylthiotransferase MtaB